MDFFCLYPNKVPLAAIRVRPCYGDKRETRLCIDLCYVLRRCSYLHEVKVSATSSKKTQLLPCAYWGNDVCFDHRISCYYLRNWHNS